MKKLLTFILVLVSLFTVVAVANTKEVEAASASDDVKALFGEYYNNGTYTKKTTINLTEEAVVDLAQHFHVENHLVRTTYYTPEALWMSQGAEGEGVKYSYYGSAADNGGVTYGVATTPNVAPEKVSVVLKGEGKESMEAYYTTLADLKDNTAAWTVDGNGFSTTDSTVLSWFLDFTAPCLYGSVFETHFFTYTKAYVEEQGVNLVLRLYVTQENGEGAVSNNDNILSEAIIDCGKEALYYYNDLGLTNVYAYMWNSTENNTWPGKQMEKVNGHENWYFIEVTNGYTSVIFNTNNGLQTGDITINLNNPYHYSLFTAGKASMAETEAASAARTTSSTWTLRGSMNGWSSTANKLTKIGDNLYGTKVTLSATSYTFKFVNSSTWYGNNGTMDGNANGWTFSTSEGDCTLKAKAGTYWFVINSSDKKVMVGLV